MLSPLFNILAYIFLPVYSDISLQSIQQYLLLMPQEQEHHIPQPNSFPVFSKALILKPHIVIEHSSKSKRQMQEFIFAFNKRIETELTYQKNLNQCSKILQKFIEPTSQKCLSYISSAFKVDNEQRGNQARDLAQSLRTEVVQPMTQSLKNYNNIIKKAQKKFKKLNKDYVNFMEDYIKAKEDFYVNEKEAKEMIITKNIYRFTSQYSQEKKNKLIAKIMQSIKQKTSYQKSYKTSVNQLNEIIQIYQKQATEMLDQLQQAQRQQIKLESDAIRKLIVCEVSMFKNVQYDLINISKQMQKMYAENDIQSFKKQAINFIMTDQKEKEKDKDMSLKTIEFDESLLTVSLKNVEEDYYTWLLSIKKNKGMRKIMELRMKQLNPQLNKNEPNGQQGKQEVKNGQKIEEKTQQNKEVLSGKQIQAEWASLPSEFFNPPPNPNGNPQKIVSDQAFKDFLSLSQLINITWTKGQAFSAEKKTNFINLIQKNHFLRILGYLYIEEYRIEHQVLMNWENFQRAGDLIKALIQVCQKFDDVFTLKGILALIFTFYSIKDQKSKKSMYQIPMVGQCQIWKREDYWQASIFQSTYEEMPNFGVQKGETHSETLLREKNIIFSQLASYCHYMIMLGITSKNVRKIVGKYCRLYEISEDQNRDLSKMISNTLKQSKQMNASNSSNSTPTSSLVGAT